MSEASGPELRTYVGIALVGLGLLASLESPGCGGIVLLRQPDDQDGGVVEGTGGFAESGGSAGSPTKPPRKKPSTPICGNGVLETGEDCDLPNLGEGTCAGATLGMFPNGSLSCSDCIYDTSGCYANQSAGGGFAGGFGGEGAVFGAGGTIFGGGGGPFGGSGGTMPIGDASLGGSPSDPYATCYNQGGIPVPSGGFVTCDFGSDATNQCFTDYLSLDGTARVKDPTCGFYCACTDCASVYDQCVKQGGCLSILLCAEAWNCDTISSCNTISECQTVIAEAGGTTSTAATLFDTAAGCVLGSGCSFVCITPL